LTHLVLFQRNQDVAEWIERIGRVQCCYRIDTGVDSISQVEHLSGWMMKSPKGKGRWKKKYFILRYGFLYYGDKDTVQLSTKQLDIGALDFPDRDLLEFTSLNLRVCLDIKGVFETLSLTLTFPDKVLNIKVFLTIFLPFLFFRQRILLITTVGFLLYQIQNTTTHPKRLMAFALFINILLLLLLS